MAEQQTRERKVVYNRAKLWEIILFTFNNTSTNCYLFSFGFVAYYAQGVVGIVALLVSAILGGIRFFDGAIDPAIGVFIDKLETKYGKYRPVMIIGNLILILSYIMIFSTHRWPDAAKMVVFVLALLVHKIGYSLQASVTKAGQTVLTNDPEQRPLFGVFDGIFNIGVFTGGQIFIARVLQPRHGGFTLEFFYELAIIFMLLSFTLCILAIIGISSKDKKEYFGLGEATTETKSLKDYWQVIKGNRPLQTLCLAAASDKLAVTLFQDSVTTVILFGVVLGNYALSGDINAISVIPDLLITFAATALARKAGLKKSFATCITAALACMVGLGLIIGTTTPGAISLSNVSFVTVIFVLLYSCGKSLLRTPTTLVITMTADVSDYETATSGRYVAGAIGTIFSFIDTLAASLGPVLIGVVCASIGFATEYPTVDTVFSQELRIGALLLVSIIPAALMVISLIFMKLYSLDKQAMVQVQETIQDKKDEIAREVKNAN